LTERKTNGIVDLRSTTNAEPEQKEIYQALKSSRNDHQDVSLILSLKKSVVPKCTVENSFTYLILTSYRTTGGEDGLR